MPPPPLTTTGVRAVREGCTPHQCSSCTPARPGVRLKKKTRFVDVRRITAMKNDEGRFEVTPLRNETLECLHEKWYVV